ncbi:MAG: hypothetical protein U0325_36960 [Polyangiales bacterium]
MTNVQWALVAAALASGACGSATVDDGPPRTASVVSRVVVAGLPRTAPEPTCGAAETACGGACVDLASDPAHCGGCGFSCGAGTSCVGARCAGGGGVVAVARRGGAR